MRTFPLTCLPITISQQCGEKSTRPVTFSSNDFSDFLAVHCCALAQAFKLDLIDAATTFWRVDALMMLVYGVCRTSRPLLLNDRWIGGMVITYMPLLLCTHFWSFKNISLFLLFPLVSRMRVPHWLQNWARNFLELTWDWWMVTFLPPQLAKKKLVLIPLVEALVYMFWEDCIDRLGIPISPKLEDELHLWDEWQSKYTGTHQCNLYFVELNSLGRLFLGIHCSHPSSVTV